MTTVEPKLEVGDFARNKIHGYITMLYKRYSDVELKRKSPWEGWDALIVKVPDDWATDFIDDWATDFIKVGTLRSELINELEKVSSTLPLILKAKEHLDRLNEGKVLDNLTYIELLHKLNEQEKQLKNENQL
jgi:hypothetical protein